jgi:hypothetical protein
MMFCGFCEQPCDDSYETQEQRILAYGQKGKLEKSTYYCDDACMKATIRNKLEPSMRAFIEFSNNISKSKMSPFDRRRKEYGTYILTIRSLAKYLKACFSRKPREELKQHQDQAKRLLHEAFVYETLGNQLSMWNASFLDDGVLKAWAK